MLRYLLPVSLLLFISSASAADDIDLLKQKVRQKTQVMVLGTLHLGSIKADIDLTDVNDVLAKYAPTAIGVESLRGPEIVTMMADREAYQGTIDDFVGDELVAVAEQLQSELGLSPAEATDKMEELVGHSVITDVERVALIKVALAGYNEDTAVLHWLKLADNEKKRLPESAKTLLSKRARGNNETVVLATQLALRQNLNTIYAIDDHLDKDAYADVVKRLMPSYQKSQYTKELVESEYMTQSQRLMKVATETGKWLPVYNWLNSPEYSGMVINTEWATFVDKDLDVEPALARLALWEVRNLNTVSNIRRVAAENIGGRILIIIGVSHKVFLEKYLSNMIGIELVQFSDYVKE